MSRADSLVQELELALVDIAHIARREDISGLELKSLEKWLDDMVMTLLDITSVLSWVRTEIDGILPNGNTT